MLIRYIKSEMEKGKHTLHLLFHILAPLVAILIVWLYYIGRDVNFSDKLSLFYRLFSFLMIIGISIVVAINVGFEEEAHFQRILTIESRVLAWYSKLIYLYLLGFLTTIVGVVGVQIIIAKDYSITHMLLLISAFLLPSLIIYPIHLLINIRFSKAISIIFAFVMAVIGLLLLTLIGDKTWQWIPYDYSGRLSSYLISIFYLGLDKASKAYFFDQIKVIIVPLTIFITLVQIIPIIFIKRFEGRSFSE